MITINLLRISPDSAYLEFSIECPINYKFTKLYIKKYDMVPLDETDNLWRDCSHLYSTTTLTPTKQVLRISTEALSGLTIENGASTIFYVQFGISYNTSLSVYKGLFNPVSTYALNETIISSGVYYKSLVNGNTGNLLTDTGKWEVIPTIPDVVGCCSDVNKVYTLLKDYVLDMDADCLEANDYNTLVRDYMVLYGHTEAMRLERFDEAEVFYDILKKSFSNCSGGTTRENNTRNLNTCNCK